jgi:hypothetical protein
MSDNILEISARFAWIPWHRLPKQVVQSKQPVPDFKFTEMVSTGIGVALKCATAFWKTLKFFEDFSMFCKYGEAFFNLTGIYGNNKWYKYLKMAWWTNLMPRR